MEDNHEGLGGVTTTKVLPALLPALLQYYTDKFDDANTTTTLLPTTWTYLIDSTLPATFYLINRLPPSAIKGGRRGPWDFC